jgi:murein DD-endopeptidase MepM/ murein hydrolase activator NlpD
MTTSHPGIRGRRPSTGESIATTTRNLERYAEGLLEGMRVARGDILGFVGSTGNADSRTPHLHFAIFEFGGGRP